MQEKFSRRIITEEKFEKTLQRMESACLFAEMKTLSKNMRTYWGGVTLGMMDAIITLGYGDEIPEYLGQMVSKAGLDPEEDE